MSHIAIDTWSNERRLEFLEAAIELREKHLRERIDPRFITSFNVVNSRLDLPRQCRKDIQALIDTHPIHSDAFKKGLLKIESALFGNI